MIRLNRLPLLLLLLTAIAVPGCSDGDGDAAAIATAEVEAEGEPETSGGSVADGEQAEADEDLAATAIDEPWDYSPYRVLVWVVSDNADVDAASLQQPLREYLERDFLSIWRMDFADAPVSIQTVAGRGMGRLDYDSITAADPVLAVKRDHPEAIRIRIADNVGQYVKKVFSTPGSQSDVLARADAAGDETLAGVAERLEPIDGDANAVAKRWEDESTEAVLLPRGMAVDLDDPEAKLITPPITGLVAETIDSYDKIFMVRLQTDQQPIQIEVVEIDSLMRHFGPVATARASNLKSLPAATGHAITRAFAPVIRIENAGQGDAKGLLRAGGLVLDEKSPAAINVDDVLEPMTRKNDRNGDPFIIGPLEWAYLIVTELEGRYIEMDFYSGRGGGLQGRKNKRTFRTALKVRPVDESTTVRLHLRNEPDFPLIGYELYERELDSKSMTFVGRTNWDGRIEIPRNDDALRLLYVKNGGAVLARLPLVPGLTDIQIADLSGDDIRLQAEAYIRGVQNSIVDLVAIRELFKARIRLRLERGEVEKAEELLAALRKQPSNEALASDMGKRQSAYIEALGPRNANQSRKVDEMFTETRELLSKQINPALIREVEGWMIQAKNNGGRLPPQKDESQEEEEQGGVPVAAAE